MEKTAEEQILSMWHDWHKDQQNKDKWQGLYKALKPNIEKAMKNNLYGSNIPKGVHFAEAVQNFDNAIKTFNPAAGAKLSSWVQTQVGQKGKRVNAQYSNITYIPESRYFKVSTFENAKSELWDKLQREPSTQELADHLAWSPKEVTTIRKELRKQLVGTEEVGGAATFYPSDIQTKINYVANELSQQELLVYEYLFGRHGRPTIVDPKKISEITHMPVEQVRNVKARIIRKIKGM